MLPQLDCEGGVMVGPANERHEAPVVSPCPPQLPSASLPTTGLESKEKDPH